MGTNLKSYNVKFITSNLRSVFRSGDIGKLSKATYQFLIGPAGFIAHYNLYGFQGEYVDLAKFAHTIRTSEYQYVGGSALGRAHHYESDPFFTREYGAPYVASVVAGLRAIDTIAYDYLMEGDV